MSQEVLLCVVNYTAIFGDSVNLDMQSSESCDKCFDLDAELLKIQNVYNELSNTYSQLEKHCISLELIMQLNQENFQKDKSSNNQYAFEIPDYFENNDLKAQLQAKDNTIRMFKLDLDPLAIRYVVPTGRVVVPTGRYVVLVGNVIVVSAGRLNVIPTGRVLSPDDARDIWNAVKARFGGNAESKKMRKSMLKQEFSKLRIGKAEGLHKGYDRMQKILSQLNQLKAKPEDEDINLKFLRALPLLWSQDAGDAGEFALMGVTSELRWDDSAFSVFTTNSEDVEGRPIFHRFAIADSMKVVPLPLSGDYTSLSDHSDHDESQMYYGTMSSTSSDSKSVSNDFVSCDDSDKSLDVNKNDFALSDSSVKSSEPKPNDSIFCASTSSVSTSEKEAEIKSNTSKVNIPPARPQLVPTGKPKVFAPVPTGRHNRPFPVPTDREYSPLPNGSRRWISAFQVLYMDQHVVGSRFSEDSPMLLTFGIHCCWFEFKYVDVAFYKDITLIYADFSNILVKTQSLRYVVPTGRVVVPTGRYVVPAGNVIVVSAGRLSVIPTGRVLIPVKIYLEWDPSIESRISNNSKPNHSWGSNATYVPSSSSLVNDRLSRLFFACALVKSKKSSHQLKAEDTNQEKLYLLNIDLCGLMRVESINGKKYILTSAKVKTVNDDVQVHALVDGKKVVANEASIRHDLRLNDAEGTACIPNATIFKELARMGKHKIRKKQRKEKEVLQEEPPTDKHIPIPSYDPLTSAKIKKLKKRVKKLKGKKKKRTHGQKRLYKVGLSTKIISSDETGRMNEEDLFGVHDLSGDEVFVDVTTSENIEQDATVAEKEVSTADPVTTGGEVVTADENVKVAAVATTLQISKDELTLAQTLMEIKVAKPKAKWVTVQEPSETTSPKPIVSSQQLSKPKDKARLKWLSPKDL
nr:ribonuclease H-like domain-containing protein [Tanacetum cinerariifolium]